MQYRIWHGAVLALVLACAQACASTANTEPRPKKQATPEQAPAARQPKASTSAGVPVPVESSELATPVSVVALPASEARPCERMCSRVGDCLREGDNIDASYLEISCLDLCVNVDPSQPVARRFHDCGKQDACAPLLDCARSNWDETAAARVEFVPELVAAPSYDACELVCGGLHSCMYHSLPLHLLDDRDRDEQFDREVAQCISTCDPNQMMMIDLAACTRVDSCEQQWECWQQAQANHY